MIDFKTFFVKENLPSRKKSLSLIELPLVELPLTNESASNDYFDQYETECEQIQIEPKKSKFEGFKLWFNDIVRFSIIYLLI